MSNTNAKVFVKHLPTQIHEDDLKRKIFKFFEPIGRIKDIVPFISKGALIGSGIVEYCHSSDFKMTIYFVI